VKSAFSGILQQYFRSFYIFSQNIIRIWTKQIHSCPFLTPVSHKKKTAALTLMSSTAASWRKLFMADFG
jgi:exopolysaccharide biosynthesis predicted pyruvyltransferase EpsI